MFVEGGYDKKMKGLETERQVFLDRKTKKQIYNTYFERQKEQNQKQNIGRQKDERQGTERHKGQIMN